MVRKLSFMAIIVAAIWIVVGLIAKTDPPPKVAVVEIPTPTVTPRSTATPRPTVTPTPTCPPVTWHMINTDPPLTLSDSEAARQAFLAEVKTSTKSVPIRGLWVNGGLLGIGRQSADFDIYLTYLSPHLIVSAVHQEAIRRGNDEKQERDLLLEVNQRLIAQNSLIFVLYIKSNNPDTTVNLGSMTSAVTLLTTDGREIKPNRYEPLFDQPFDMRAGVRWGYLFFPLSGGCSAGQLANAIDVNTEPSLSVQIKDVSFSYQNQPPMLKTNLSWNYNLVPIDLSLETALNIQAPEQALPSSDPITLQNVADIKVDPIVKTPKVLFLKCISPLCEMVMTGS